MVARTASIDWSAVLVARVDRRPEGQQVVDALHEEYQNGGWGKEHEQRCARTEEGLWTQGGGPPEESPKQKTRHGGGSRQYGDPRSEVTGQRRAGPSRTDEAVVRGGIAV